MKNSNPLFDASIQSDNGEAMVKVVPSKRSCAMAPELAGYDEPLLTPQDLSQWLQTPMSTIYKWTALGYIPCIKMGGKIQGKIRFVRIEIMRWLKRRSRRGRTAYKPDVDDVAV